MTLVRPERLKPGRNIRIVSPASAPDPIVLKRGIRLLSDAGYHVSVGKHVLDRRGYFAGNDADRAADLNEALNDPDIRGIFCVRGGYGSARILDMIDYEAARSDPKIIVGYSDITTLLLAFMHFSRVVTFHGPLMGGMASPWSYDILFKLLQSDTVPFEWPLPPDCEPPMIIQSGSGAGKSVGGCLTLLSTSCGTSIEPDLSGAVLFIEEVNEAPYRIDRMLTHLKNCRWFKDTSAILFGTFTDCIPKPNDTEPTLTIPEIVRDLFSGLTCPIIMNLPFGHSRHHITIPLGVSFSIENDRIIQLTPGVS